MERARGGREHRGSQEGLVRNPGQGMLLRPVERSGAARVYSGRHQHLRRGKESPPYPSSARQTYPWWLLIRVPETRRLAPPVRPAPTWHQVRPPSLSH